MDSDWPAASTLRGPAGEWRAWHVFLADGEAQERLLVEAVLPEVLRLRDGSPPVRAFFIRYWENGPHIRLRLSGADEAGFSAVGARLRDHAEALAGPAPAGGFGPEMRYDGWHADPGALPWFPQGTTVEIDYEPETRRYGGRAGIRINEDLFVASSLAALGIVRATQSERPKRQRVALELLVAALGAAIQDEAAFLKAVDRMALGWRGFVADAPAAEERAVRAAQVDGGGLRRLIRSAMAGDDAQLSPAAAHWSRLIRRYLAQLEALAAEGLLISPLTGVPAAGAEEARAAIGHMLMSQCHMMNNRLGFPPQVEFIFARMLTSSLRELAGA